MKLPTQNEIAKALTAAPHEVSDFIFSEELAEVFETLRANHALHLDEAGTVSDAINAVAVGLTPLSEFRATLEAALPETPREKVDALTKDINELVFQKLRRSAAERPRETAMERVSIPEQRLGGAVLEAPRDITAPLPRSLDPYREPIE